MQEDMAASWRATDIEGLRRTARIENDKEKRGEIEEWVEEVEKRREEERKLDSKVLRERGQKEKWIKPHKQQHEIEEMEVGKDLAE